MGRCGGAERSPGAALALVGPLRSFLHTAFCLKSFPQHVHRAHHPDALLQTGAAKECSFIMRRQSPPSRRAAQIPPLAALMRPAEVGPSVCFGMITPHQG